MYRLKFSKQIKQAIRSKTIGWYMEQRSLRLKKHIVVFESDDWGSIRMPSLDAFHYLVEKGVPLRKPDSYDYVDSLESNDDLLFLMETLNEVRGGDGMPAVMTMNTVMCNPDFDKIEKDRFNNYFYEIFIDTYKRYPGRDKVKNLWIEGITNKVFKPQLHGREHLNFQRWMTFLKMGDENVMKAFKQQVLSLGSSYHFQETINPYTLTDYDEIYKSIKEAIKIFEDIFGFRPESFIAPCYIWDPCIEEVLNENGVVTLQGTYFQKYSEYEQSVSNKSWQCHFLGERNCHGQVYLTRNCRFEPSEVSKYNADRSFNEIRKHLDAGRPAIVSCHRLNFIGILNQENRDRNLRQFKSLLKKIVCYYPDVVFMSSDQLGKLILSS